MQPPTLIQIFLIWLIPISIEVFIAVLFVWTARNKPQNPSE